MADQTNQQKIVEIPDFLTVRELAELLEASPIDVIKELMKNGVMASITQQIDYETAAIVASEMGVDALQASAIQEEQEAAEAQDAPSALWRTFYVGEDPSALVDRPPVVTILGHVDHGKTSLLDVIRQAHVQAGEAGGITQHIGAYQIQHSDQRITFLDTPGHEAFTAMRRRGAQGADIAVLVVAADDGVMPQTREALAHAQAANVPILVALSKVDKSNANPDRVKQELSEVGLVPDEWDGDTLIVPVAARTLEDAQGIEDLLEAILLIAEATQIKANPNAPAAGTVLEASIEKSRGVMATLLVQNGTLRTGDIVAADSASGRIKAMFNENGENVEEAGPSSPVQIMGLSGVPEAGTIFRVYDDEREARDVAEQNYEDAQSPIRVTRVATLEDFFANVESGEAKELNMIIKADVQGSLEPIVNSLQALDKNGIKVKILHAETGRISESDIMLASASQAIVAGFNVTPDNAAERAAEVEGIEIRTYKIIYKLIEEVEKALEGLLDPVYEEVTIGVAEVRKVFKIPRQGKIAGSYVIQGEARRNAKARIVRDGEVLHESGVSSLKRFEENVSEVRSDFECGISVDGFQNYKEGDRIEFFVKERVQ